MPVGILDGQQHIVDAEMCNRKWGGSPAGLKFRCALCGHKFVPGNIVRFVITNTRVASEAGAPSGNPFVCSKCDGTNEYVYTKLKDMKEEWNKIKQQFWWFLSDVENAAIQEYENDMARERRRNK
jgi:hypothetical protein